MDKLKVKKRIQLRAFRLQRKHKREIIIEIKVSISIRFKSYKKLRKDRAIHSSYHEIIYKHENKFYHIYFILLVKLLCILYSFLQRCICCK